MVMDMTECYELPVFFTEAERKAYASWGMKKEKVMIPFAVATILIYIAAAAFVGMRVWGVREDDHLWFQILVQSHWIGDITGALAIGMTILLLGPIDWLLDKIWKKPAAPMRLAVELSGNTVQVRQTGGKHETASQPMENHVVSDAESFLNIGENTIYYQGNWLKIGENTIETIYPPEKQHAWMDHPAAKASDITDVRKFMSILEGYEKSLESVRREQEWLQKHGRYKDDYNQKI